MSEYTLKWQARRIEELECEVAELKAQLAEQSSESNLQIQVVLQHQLGVSPKEARLLICLWRARGKCVSRASVRHACDMPDVAPEISKQVDTYLCRLRKKIGVKINTIWSVGIALDPIWVDRIDEMVRQHNSLTRAA